jgi:hypothetical protein
MSKELLLSVLAINRASALSKIQKISGDSVASVAKNL